MELDYLLADSASDAPSKSRAGRVFSAPGAPGERELFRRWRDRHDIAAVDRVVRLYRDFAVEIAEGYYRYALSPEDVAGEALVGLMRAACRFDPDRGIRFATFAHGWVHAALQRYVLVNWAAGASRTPAARDELIRAFRSTCSRLRAMESARMPATFADHDGPVAAAENQLWRSPAGARIRRPPSFAETGDVTGAIGCFGHVQT